MFLAILLRSSMLHVVVVVVLLASTYPSPMVGIPMAQYCGCEAQLEAVWLTVISKYLGIGREPSQ